MYLCTLQPQKCSRAGVVMRILQSREGKNTEQPKKQLLASEYQVKITTPVDEASDSDSTEAKSLQEHKWRMAGRFALANCAIFLIMAVFAYALKSQLLAIVLSAPAVFFLGSLLTFVLMVQSGAALAPITWYVLGAGIYFGLGGVAGGLRVHPYSEQIFGSDTLYLIQGNLLNACSVLIVVGVALAFDRMKGSARRKQGDVAFNRDGVLQKFFPYVLVIAATGVFLKFVFFPNSESLLLRSVAGKIYLIIPTCFLLLGMLWQRICWQLRAVALIIFTLEILNGLVAFNKYQVIYAMLALAIGMWMIRTSWKSLFLTMVGFVLIFSAINPLVTLGRAHLAYDSQNNTLATRMEILRDAFVVSLDSDQVFLTNQDEGVVRMKVKEMGLPAERARAIGRRFEVASIQGYLINEYNSGRPGNTISNFWVTFIPRLFWPQKPVITNLGGELNAKYYNDPTQTKSAIAPTYSAEAYWNYGAGGVVLASVLLGLAIGWLTHYSFLAVSGARLEYFVIAFSAAIWACFVESWLVSSFLGEFVIFVVIITIARIMMKCCGYLKNKKAWSFIKIPSSIN